MTARHVRALTRRGALLIGAYLLFGCAPSVPALNPKQPPRDRAATLQTLFSGRPVPPIGRPELPWHVVSDPPADVRLDGVELVVRTEPGRRAFVAPRVPLATLPYDPPRFIEELGWVARVAVRPPMRFFVLLTLRFAGEPGAILVQPTPFDLQITSDADRPERGVSRSLPHLVGDGEAHAWRLRLTEQRTELFLDGTPIWSLDGRRVLSAVAFGETITDQFHGGELRLRDVAYVRRPV